MALLRHAVLLVLSGLLAPAADSSAAGPTAGACAEGSCDAREEESALLQTATVKKAEANFNPFSPSRRRASDTCRKSTGGSCRLFACQDGRDAVCRSGSCDCESILCTDENGNCRIPKSTWKAKVFPVDEQHRTFPGNHANVKTALCLGGGGGRAAAAALGILRALMSLGLMGGVDMLSSISGSLFVTVPFMFAADRGGTAPLWGNDTDPSKLTPDVLDYDTSAFATTFADGWGSTWGTVKQGVWHLYEMSNDGKLSAGDYNRMWRKMMQEQFLAPFDLGDGHSLIAGSSSDVQRIKRDNPQLEPVNFLLPRPDRPKVFVIGGTLLAEDGAGHVDAVSYEIAPDYSATPFWTNVDGNPYKPVNATSPGTLVGGGLIETFAIGGEPPADPKSGELPSPSKFFTLADAMAIGTYADFLPKEEWFGWTPDYNYWPMKSNAPHKRFMLGDGGFLEDTGVHAALRRGADKLVICLFPGGGQLVNDDFCTKEEQIKKGTFDPSTYDSAGKITESLRVMHGYGYDDGTWHKRHNTIFSQRDLFSVGCRLQRLKEQGKPLVTNMNLKVQPNDYWGIKGGNTVEITYFYLEWSKEFGQHLPAETLRLVESMQGFPSEISTGLWMKPREIKLMAALAEYAVKENADLFRKILQRSR